MALLAITFILNGGNYLETLFTEDSNRPEQLSISCQRPSVKIIRWCFHYKRSSTWSLEIPDWFLINIDISSLIPVEHLITKEKKKKEKEERG